MVPLDEQSEDLTITILYDNTTHDPRLRAEWGFAALIECGGHTLLFDTDGDAPTLLGNMEILGIDPICHMLNFTKQSLCVIIPPLKFQPEKSSYRFVA